MYIAIYKFKIKKDKEAQFKANWAIHTESIFKYFGSKGSRLHKVDSQDTYIAYAQWPSKQIYEKDGNMSNFLPEEIKARSLMHESLESSETLFLMETIDDRLR